ncbi:MAG: hypothetical protein FWG73_07835 [Planctomycetaceae bacterium]|nr:hypothetical protein [Planctomycetaceae bacterium]
MATTLDGMAVRNSYETAFNPCYSLSGFGEGTPVYASDIGSTACVLNMAGHPQVYWVGCFPKTELVHVATDSCVPIGSLNVGDKISSWDVEREKMQYTAVTGIHVYTVTEIICFNNDMWVSCSHPLLVMEAGESGVLTPKWKVAFDVNVGDYVIGSDGKLAAIKSKSKHWSDAGMEVLNLSTDSGSPFLVRNCVVRAENAHDNLEWADITETETKTLRVA